MAGFWICAGMQLWQGSEYSTIRECPVSAFASVTQGSEYAWIWMNNAL